MNKLLSTKSLIAINLILAVFMVAFIYGIVSNMYEGATQTNTCTPPTVKYPDEYWTGCVNGVGVVVDYMTGEIKEVSE